MAWYTRCEHQQFEEIGVSEDRADLSPSEICLGKYLLVADAVAIELWRQRASLVF